MDDLARQQQFKSLYDSALALAISGESEKAELGFDQAAEFAPDLWCSEAERLFNEDHDLAIHHLAKALEFSKSGFVRAIVLNDMGRIYARRGQNKEALELFKQALSSNPGHPGIMTNTGLVNRWLGNLVEAERWLTRALNQNPWESAAALELAFVKMLGGNYPDGFKLYECRFRVPGGALHKLECDKPEWNGSNGKRLFVYGEQGSGDIFLMLRYAKLIKEMGIHQTWGVHNSMLPLISTMPEIDSVIGGDAQVDDFDCHIPAASLPRMFGTSLETIPEPVCIPKPQPHDYGPGFHVGIVWRGSKTQNNDSIRSTNLSQWLPVLNVPGVIFHSLQVDEADEALAYPQIQIENKPSDWMDTARRVCGLDLVISVDTSMVHLCGSLGVECWCALHCRPYFVYPIIKDYCPWYVSVRLFKQKTEFEWQPVFESIAHELKKLTTT